MSGFYFSNIIPEGGWGCRASNQTKSLNSYLHNALKPIDEYLKQHSKYLPVRIISNASDVLKTKEIGNLFCSAPLILKEWLVNKTRQNKDCITWKPEPQQKKKKDTGRFQKRQNIRISFSHVNGECYVQYVMN